MAAGRAKVEIKSIVENIGKHTKFLQPLYEAIANSLEAKATNIKVEISLDGQIVMEGTTPNISGFSITDNGEGFTKKNREEFCKLWTDHKKEKYGCKGSGRYAWLSVFKSINIVSGIASENKRITIPFSIDFDDEKDIQEENYKINSNFTTLEFNDIKQSFFDQQSGLDLKKIEESVLSNLLIKLFILKKNKKEFNIEIYINEEKCIINNNSIPSLFPIEFSLENQFVMQGDNKIMFTIYYHFEDGGNSKQAYYCADNRVVKNIENDGLGFYGPFPDNASLTMLLTSKYLDDRCNDTRDDFPVLSGKRTRNFDSPLLLTDISEAVKIKMHEIIRDRYQEIDNINKLEQDKAISIKPYLSEYIIENKDIVKSEKRLIAYAEKRFAKDKESAQKELMKSLRDNSLDSNKFIQSVARVSAIAQKELGEYILYRQEIISALDIATRDSGKNEKFIHEIFMKKNTSLNNVDEKRYLHNNLWLLDDKFMTYSYAASDMQINKILTEIDNENEKRGVFMGNKKPDLTVFYNNENDKDLVVIEFKKPYANLAEKEMAATEIVRNIGIIKKNMNTVNSIYGYIITSLDDEIVASLETNDFIPLFTNGDDNKLLYKYNKNNNAHIFVIDLNAITHDAFARNKTFLDILKK